MGVTIAASKRGRPLKVQKQEAPKAVKVAKKVLESSNVNANKPETTTGQTLVKNVAKEMERLVLYTAMLEKQNIALTARLLEIEKIVRDWTLLKLDESQETTPATSNYFVRWG